MGGGKMGIPELVDKGYSSVPLCDGADVATCGRGLWHIRQSEGRVLFRRQRGVC